MAEDNQELEPEQVNDEKVEDNEDESNNEDDGGDWQDNGGPKNVYKPARLPGKVGQTFKGFQDKRQLKRLKKQVRKDARKDPYHRLLLSRKNTKLAARRNIRVQWQLDAYKREYEKQKKIADELQSTDKLWLAQNHLKPRYDKTQEKSKGLGRALRDMVAIENIKRFIEGPKGCLKDIKGCLFSAMVCLTITGGVVITGILKICGVF